MRYEIVYDKFFTNNRGLVMNVPALILRPEACIPEQIRELQEVQKEINDLSCYIEGLRERLFLDISNGWSSGDVMQDFAISSCLGLCDEAVLDSYRTLQESIYRHVGKYMLVIQKAECRDVMGVVIIRNMYLACVASEDIDFDIRRGLMGLPTSSRCVLFQEKMDSDLEPIGVETILTGSRLYVGPLESEHCAIGSAKQQGNDLSYVHPTAPCTIFFHPWDMSELWRQHMIDGEFLRVLTDQYIVGIKS